MKPIVPKGMPRKTRQVADIATAEPLEMQGSTAAPDIFAKTKLCKFYVLGICAKGENCLFAHERAELNPMPDLFRTKLCTRLINRGSCDDTQCKYAHSKEELRTAEIRPVRDPPVFQHDLSAFQQVESYSMRQTTFVPVMMVPLQPGFADAQLYQLPSMQQASPHHSQPMGRSRRRRGHQHQTASGLQGTSSDEGFPTSGKDGTVSGVQTPSTGTMSTSAQANDGNSSDADFGSNNSTHVVQHSAGGRSLADFCDDDGVVVVKNTFLSIEPRAKEFGLRQVHTAGGRLDQMCGQD